MTPRPFRLQDNLIAYGRDGRGACIARSFDEIANSHADFIVGSFDFSDDDSVHADHWEVHPAGDEILCVLEGCLEAEIDGGGAVHKVLVGAGHALIVPQARWHRLHVLEPGRLLVVTPRPGTELRPHARATDPRHQSAE